MIAALGGLAVGVVQVLSKLMYWSKMQHSYSYQFNLRFFRENLVKNDSLEYGLNLVDKMLTKFDSKHSCGGGGGIP